MTMVLSPSQAVSLDTLLLQVNTQGVPAKLILAEQQPMPLIRGIGSLQQASAQELSFLANPQFFQAMLQTQAGAVILPQRAIDLLPAPMSFAIIQCEDPYLLYARISQWFDATRRQSTERVCHASAVVHPSVQLGDNVAIGPLTVIEAGAVIGANSTIGPGCVVGEGVQIGEECLLHANVTLYHDIILGNRVIIHSGSVIGADGFGNAPDNTSEKGAWCKIAQLGRVLIGDDVEIGACTTVDRGAINDTLIGKGVRLDNQIMIGHNCEIGDHTAMAACVGIAGSTKIGKRCTVAGAGMVSGHISLADDVHISGATSVISNIDKPGRYTSTWPSMEHREWQKNAAALTKLYDLRRRVQSLEKRLETKLNDASST